MKEEKKLMNKCLNERAGQRNMEENEKSPQESQSERIRDFLKENIFKRFPRGRAALWLKLLKARWKNILTAQS